MTRGIWLPNLPCFSSIFAKRTKSSAGVIPGALHAPRGFLEFMADPECPMYKRGLGGAQRLILYCATGGRSSLAAKTLMEMGYTDVFSMAGGLAAWKAGDGPLTAPDDGK